MVADGRRVGRIAGDGVEWVGQIPKITPFGGENTVVSINGRYPDSVGAFSQSSIGRAPTPTFVTVTGKGTSHTEAPGGGWGSMSAARVGESTILATDSSADGHRLITVRGPRLVRSFTTAKSGCRAGEATIPSFVPQEAIPALPPTAFESTTAGTLVSLGTLCTQRGAGAEVWDKATGQSRIVALGAWWKRVGYAAQLLKGSGDELWAFSDGFQPVLHYVDGNFAPVPELGSPIENVFVSPTGQLYASTSSQTIYRFADGTWGAVGRMAEPLEPRGALVVDAEGSLWAGSAGKVYKLREGPRGRVPAEDICKSWFVYLYAASSTNGATYTYPATRTALSTFPTVSELGLVELAGWPKHVGLAVASKSQGEAVIAHIKANMKGEDPKLFCYAPKSPRRIDIGAKAP